MGGGGSLYCFSCVTPNTYEVGMVAAMAKLKVGMFECNGYDIISNVSAAELFKDFPETAKMLKDKVHVINMDLYVKTVKGPAGHDTSSPATDPNSPLYQGKNAIMKHLANTPVFKEVWQTIFDLGNFEKYDYTCKLDIDAVIVPQRLSGMLASRPVRPEFFLNSLHDMYGNFLHGPVELISKLGMYAYRDAKEQCFKKIDVQLYGEDFWANKCWSLLGIPVVKTLEMPLLYDEYEWGKSAFHHCDALNPDPAVFHQNQYFGVYHPRKNMEDWLACREQTGVPRFISKDQKHMAIKMAGPGHPDKILGKMFEIPPMASFQWNLPIVSLVSVAIAGVALVALGSFAVRKWNSEGLRAVESPRTFTALEGQAAEKSLEAGLIQEIE
ncbi:unnamed protein product [Symbiodinium pilosum]|uniref:Uncharacterized protein n=1 Tax=Symbiodinium pilosum TaxID=2952 RepID=A0A812XVV8_SYMPI|nr:unnamed protein product [Symbiodinium pilosum]